MRRLCCILAILLMVGCIAPSSRFYKPLEWEKSYFMNSDKSVMPKDVISDPNKYEGKLIHWVGIIDTFWITQDTSGCLLTALLDQKYYDYIEDFSIQREKIFLSPKGEGLFVYERKLSMPVDSVIGNLERSMHKGDLGFCYGALFGVRDGHPIIQGQAMRVIPGEFYATNIFSYEVERDSSGTVTVDERGIPKLKNFHMLKVPGPGKNK